MKKSLLLIIAICFLAGAGAAVAQQQVAPRLTTVTEERYRLQPGDVFEVQYRYSPEFNQTVTVQPDGYVSLEVGGDLKVAGLTIEQARLGNALGKQISLTEKQGIVNGVGDMPNQHDILTGSQPDGRAYTDTADHTCSNYTSNAEGAARGAAGAPPPPPGPSVQLGHSDKQGGGNGSWNSTHASRGCSQANLVSTGGAGLLYCFAVN